MKELIAPDVLDRCLLELASESHLGDPGRPMSAIRSAMRDRGIDDDGVGDALEILLKKKLVEARYSRRKNPLEDMGTVISRSERSLQSRE